MGILIIIAVLVAIAFVFGLSSREKGDGLLDTLGSGCNSITNILLIIGLIACAFVYFSKK
jgi:H+/gluconate symporter-like permease